MKHLEAGLMVGLMTTVGLLLLGLIWVGFNWMMGPTIAVAMVTVVVVVTVIAVIVDWKTEKKDGDDAA